MATTNPPDDVQPDSLSISDIVNNNEIKYSFIIDYWFRNTIGINKSNKNKSVQKEILINEIIISYLRKIFRFINIPNCDNSYDKFKNSVYFTQEQYQNNFLHNTKSSIMKVLKDPNNSINFDFEFVLLLTNTQGSGSTKVKLLKEDIDIDIDHNNHCITFTIEVGDEDDDDFGFGICVMAYYAWCIVISKKCNFNKIGIKTRSVGSGHESLKYISIP